jgi:hypothetical protein
MKLSTSLVILTSVTGTMAGCYSGGQTYATDGCREAFRGAIRDLCNNGALSGYFSQGATKYACANCPWAGIRVDLAVGWRGQGGLTIRTQDCIDRLTAEANACDHGGESIVADWFAK